jgi:hypothetical protein
VIAAVDMLAAVRALGGEVKLVNFGRLKVIAPAPLTNEFIEQMRAAKPDLLTLPSSPKPQTEPRCTRADKRESGTGYRFAGDIVLPLLGRDLSVEVKARADGFRELSRRADR